MDKYSSANGDTITNNTTGGADVSSLDSVEIDDAERFLVDSRRCGGL
jgi:hypothetical protein